MGAAGLARALLLATAVAGAPAAPAQQPPEPRGFALVGEDGARHVFDPAEISGVEVRRTDWGGWAVHLALGASGAERLAGITAAQIGRTLTLVVDGETVIAPRVQEPITGGRLMISGDFDEAEARRIADAIGARPGPWQKLGEALGRIVPPPPAGQE